MGYNACDEHDYARLNCAACIERRTRPPQKPWMTGILREDLDKVRERIDPQLDSRDWRDQHIDLDDTSTARFRPANWQEQIGCLMAEDVWVQEVNGD